MKIEIGENITDYKGYDLISQKIKDNLGLEKSPVAIKFVLREKNLPEGVSKIEDNIRHCEMVQKASHGDIFYATSEEEMCKGGSAAVGLQEPLEKAKTGEFYMTLGRFSSIGSAKRTVDAIPKIDPMMYALVYAPLEKANFDPDVVAGPFLSGTPNFTLGCSGSRQYADIKEDEVIVGLNGENIGFVVNALENMI